MKKSLLIAYRLALSPLLFLSGIAMIAVMLVAHGPGRAGAFARALADAVDDA